MVIGTRAQRRFIRIDHKLVSAGKSTYKRIKVVKRQAAKASAAEFILCSHDLQNGVDEFSHSKKTVSTHALAPDIKQSKGFQAYLDSKKKHFEVYRRLAES